MKAFRFIFMIFLSMPVVAGFAAETSVVTPRLVLNQLHPTQTQEKMGDELYFDVAVLQAKKDKTYYRIPEKPIHWASDLIDKLPPITLWSEPLNPGQSVILLISLMEQDSLPMNPDDLIGSIRVKIKNENGRLQTNWSVPNQGSDSVAMSVQKEDVHKFELSKGTGHYNVYLSLQNNN